MSDEGQTKPLEVKLVGQTPKKNFLRFVPLLSLFLSFAAFVLSVMPSWNPLNQNYEQRALAGDAKAQMYLADYNFQIGEFNKSIFYYGMVVKRAKLRTNAQKERFYIACNSLGYLYASKIDGEDSYPLATRYFRRGLDIFKEEEIDVYFGYYKEGTDIFIFDRNRTNLVPECLDALISNYIYHLWDGDDEKCFIYGNYPFVDYAIVNYSYPEGYRYYSYNSHTN